MSSQLFNEFEPVSAKQWKQKIQVDLKGADYNEALVWQSLEGIHVKPFYHRDDFDSLFEPIPGQPKDWRIGQAIFIDDEVIANSLAIDVLKRGAEAIYFSSESEFNVSKVFQNFPFEKASIYFNFSFLSENFILQLKRYLSKKNATVFYNIDLVGNLSKTGNWFQNLKKDHADLESILNQTSSSTMLSVDTTIFQNAGANCVQQLAYALAHVNEYLNHFSENKLKITFKVAVGGNYFFEIAKIRALRKLYAALASQYNMPIECHIIAMPSLRNKTLYDYNINMLRTTTECMSAVLGGADTIINLPYDALYHKSNEFGERISRNQLIILKSESYFDMVSNPADGSYYIESLTQELADKGLALFKNIEAGGGYLHQLKAGILQKKIKESAVKEQTLFNEGKIKLVGTNYHTNKTDTMKEDLELYPFVKTKNYKTLLAPIVPIRLSEQIEKERLDHE
jgi:methylmalonyl-CoA mutase